MKWNLVGIGTAAGDYSVVGGTFLIGKRRKMHTYKVSNLGLCKLFVAALAGVGMAASSHAATVTLLDDKLADGTVANNNLPSSSEQWFGGSTGSAYNVTTGKGSLVYSGATNSTKLWTYFTRNQAAPDGSQPHNSVTHLNSGDTITQSLSFRVPTGATVSSVASISTNLRMGLFLDPTDARVQSNVNNDGGGSATSPWQDETGYALFFGATNAATPTGTEFQLNKRTINNTSLIGSGGAFTQPGKGGTPISEALDTDYTVQLKIALTDATHADVTASLFSGRPADNNLALLSSQTVTDAGTTFGSASVAAGGLPGSQGVYTDFDHFMFRDSSNVDSSQIDFTEFRVDLDAAVPEPSMALASLLGCTALIRRRRN
jgi:hypothetical protein